MVDKSSTAYQVYASDPTQPLANLTVHEANDMPREYNVTNLTNGYTVLTESQSFPGAVHMGKLLAQNGGDANAFYLNLFRMMITRAKH